MLELIKFYRHKQFISQDLKNYLLDLQKLIEENNTFGMMKYFLSNDFNDHIQIILNLDKLDVKKYCIEINKFCQNADVDAFVKYCLVKYLMENELINEINYTNYFNESYIINNNNYFDILNNQCFLEPINIVMEKIEDKNIIEPYLKNIWLDFCIKYYPHYISNVNLQVPFYIF